jgi:hypothetical protein
VAKVTGVDVRARTVTVGVNVGIGNGVGCGLQAERINKINPMNWNFFIRIFLWKYCRVDYIPTRKATDFNKKTSEFFENSEV